MWKWLYSLLGAGLAVLLLSSMVPAQAGPELISSYDVTVKFNDDGSAHITKVIKIQNLVDKPLIPGNGYIKLSKYETGTLSLGEKEKAFQEISNLEVRDGTGAALENKADFMKDETIITYGVWAPLDPGATATVIIEYNTPDIVAEGVLFDLVMVPAVASSFPISASSLTIVVNPATGRHVTYAPGLDVSEEGGMIILSSDGTGGVVFELSTVPLPLSSFRWATTFWVCLIIAILVVGEVSRKMAMEKGGRKGEHPLKKLLSVK